MGFCAASGDVCCIATRRHSMLAAQQPLRRYLITSTPPIRAGRPLAKCRAGFGTGKAASWGATAAPAAGSATPPDPAAANTATPADDGWPSAQTTPDMQTDWGEYYQPGDWGESGRQYGAGTAPPTTGPAGTEAAASTNPFEPSGSFQDPHTAFGGSFDPAEPYSFTADSSGAAANAQQGAGDFGFSGGPPPFAGGMNAPPVFPSDITVITPRDVEALIPLTPSVEQSRYYSPKTMPERLVQVLGSFGVSVALSKTAVLAGPALLYPVWGPWVRAGIRNVEMHLREFKSVGLWRAEVLGVNITTIPYAYARSGRPPPSVGQAAMGDTISIVIGDPWEGGARVQLTFPYLPGCEDIVAGEPAELLVLCKNESFTNFKVVREVYLPQTGMWLSEYPFINREVFLDISLAIERSRQSSQPPAPPTAGPAPGYGGFDGMGMDGFAGNPVFDFDSGAAAGAGAGASSSSSTATPPFGTGASWSGFSDSGRFGDAFPDDPGFCAPGFSSSSYSRWGPAGYGAVGAAAGPIVVVEPTPLQDMGAMESDPTAGFAAEQSTSRSTAAGAAGDASAAAVEDASNGIYSSSNTAAAAAASRAPLATDVDSNVASSSSSGRPGTHKTWQPSSSSSSWGAGSSRSLRGPPSSFVNDSTAAAAAAASGQGSPVPPWPQQQYQQQQPAGFGWGAAASGGAASTPGSSSSSTTAPAGGLWGAGATRGAGEGGVGGAGASSGVSAGWQQQQEERGAQQGVWGQFPGAYSSGVTDATTSSSSSGSGVTDATTSSSSSGSGVGWGVYTPAATSSQRPTGRWATGRAPSSSAGPSPYTGSSSSSSASTWPLQGGSSQQEVGSKWSMLAAQAIQGNFSSTGSASANTQAAGPVGTADWPDSSRTPDDGGSSRDCGSTPEQQQQPEVASDSYGAAPAMSGYSRPGSWGRAAGGL